MQAQIDRLLNSQSELTNRLQSVEANYQSALSELVTFQRGTATQDALMQNIVAYLLQLDGGKIVFIYPNGRILNPMIRQEGSLGCPAIGYRLF